MPATISASTIHRTGDAPSAAAGEGETVVVAIAELVDGAAVTVDVEVDVVVDVVVEVVVLVDVEVVVEVSVEVFVEDVVVVSDSLSLTCSLWLGATESVPVPDSDREGVGNVGSDTETLGRPDGNRDETAELAAPQPTASAASGTTRSARSPGERRLIPTRSFPGAWT